MDLMIEKTLDGELIEHFFEWIPDSQFEWVVQHINPFVAMKVFSNDGDPSVSCVRIERVHLGEKVLVNDRFLCRRGYSEFKHCFLYSCHKTLWGTPFGVIDFDGKVENL